MKNVIIIDPNKNNPLMQSLIQKGFNAITVTNPDYIYSIIISFKPEIIVIDTDHGNIRGNDICRGLKNQWATKNLHILLISDNPDKLEDFKDCNANNFISKSATPKELLAIITSHKL